MDSLMGIFNSFGHDDAAAHYNNIYHAEPVKHHASWGHEAIAGAAGFAAMRAYESHLRATGHNPSHALMKEILAGIAMAEVDKLVETKGLDWIDANRAKHMAKQQAHHLADQRYGHGQNGYDFARSQQGPSFEYNFGGGVPFGARGCPSYGYGGGGYGGDGYGGGYGGGYEGGYEGGYGGEQFSQGYGGGPGYAPAYGPGGGYPGGGYPGGGYPGQGYGGGPHHHGYHHQYNG